MRGKDSAFVWEARIMLGKVNHVREGDSMKGLCFVLLILGLFASAATLSASTLRNTDGQSYVVEVIDAGQMYRATILDGSTAALCTYTCQLILPQTGQSLTVQPYDHVVIDDGVMSVVY
jgi:hypothetical protein